MSKNALMRIIANENDEIESGEEKPDSEDVFITPKPKTKRWKWTEEMTNALLACLMESKVEHEYNGKNFMSDLVTLYGNIREKVAKQFELEHFGPVAISHVGDNLGAASLTEHKIKVSSEKRLFKMGYERIKEKVKAIQQDYRKAVTERRRSGSGKLVCDNWDKLETLWGGSPAVTTLTNSISLSESYSQDSEGEAEKETEPEETLPGDINVNSSSTSGGTIATPEERKRQRDQRVTHKFVDKKRKFMEKNLSAHQRDQSFLKVALDEIKVKENMLQALTESNKESSRAMEKIAESIASVGKSIGDGLGFLAAALANNNQSVPTQPLVNTYHQPGNLQRSSSYNEFNPGYSFTNYQHHPPTSTFYNRVQSQTAPCSEAQVPDTTNGKRYHIL